MFNRKTVWMLSMMFVVVGSARANDQVGKWLKYFEGNWSRESKMWTKDAGWVEHTSKWKCKLAAGGHTTVSTGKTSNDVEWITVDGRDGYRNAIFEYGALSTGGNWTVVFDKVEEAKLAGTIKAFLTDGRKGAGPAEIIKTGEDSYTAEVELKMEDGTIVKFSDKNTRQ